MKMPSVLFLCGLLGLTTAGAAENSSGQIEKGDFRFTYDERGITGLADPHDPFGAQIVPQGQRLGLTVRFRSGDGEWQTLAAGRLQNGTSSENRLVYASDPSEGLLTTIQTFTIDGAALDWNIELETTSNAPV